MRVKAASAVVFFVLMIHGVGAVSIDRSGARETTLRAGTRLPVTLDTAVWSNGSRVEQTVTGHLSSDVTIGGFVVPGGSQLIGYVTDARRSGRVTGLAHVGLRFTTLVVHGQRYRIETAAIGRTAPATKEKDALTIAAPAAGGALIGALTGGKKGALIGTAVGGGAGTAVVLSTRGKETGFARGSIVSVRLTAPVTLKQ
jgi:hypothetical protein